MGPFEKEAHKHILFSKCQTGHKKKGTNIRIIEKQSLETSSNFQKYLCLLGTTRCHVLQLHGAV